MGRARCASFGRDRDHAFTDEAARIATHLRLVREHLLATRLKD